MTVCGNSSLVATSTTPFPAPVAGDCCLRVRYTCECVDGVSTWVLDVVNTACIANDLCAEYAFSCSDLEYDFEAQNYCDCVGVLPTLPDPSCDPHCCDSSTTTPVTSTSSTTTTSTTTTTTTTPPCPDPISGGIGDSAVFDVTGGDQIITIPVHAPGGAPGCCYKLVISFEGTVGPNTCGIVAQNFIDCTAYTDTPFSLGEFHSDSCVGPTPGLFETLPIGPFIFTETRYLCGADMVDVTIHSGCFLGVGGASRIQGSMFWAITLESDSCA